VGILFQKRQLVKTRSEIVVTLVPHIQPYTPIVAARENHELMRSLEPLTVGPLDRFYRPYEAQLPDTFLNPRRPLMGLLEPLPPVEHVGGRGIAEDGRRKPVFPSPPTSGNPNFETRN
jgi:hypothetical protein